VVTSDVELRRRLEAFRMPHRVVRELTAVRDLGATLQLVVDSVTASLGFGAAAMNLVRGDGDLEVVAVAGPDAVREALLGRVGRRADWDALLGRAERWGELRFVPHGEAATGDVPTWIPGSPARDSSDPWHPEDALLAPLRTADGALVGALSVDLPADGRRPGPLQRELLEMYAAQAAVAVDNARLHTAALTALDRLAAEQRALRASEESFRLAFTHAPSGMIMTSLRAVDRNRVLRANPAFLRLVGRAEPDLRRHGLASVVAPDDVHLLPGDATAGRVELRLIRPDGTPSGLRYTARSCTTPTARTFCSPMPRPPAPVTCSRLQGQGQREAGLTNPSRWPAGALPKAQRNRHRCHAAGPPSRSFSPLMAVPLFPDPV